MPMVPMRRLLAGLLFSLLAILTSSAPTAWSFDAGTRTNSAYGKVGRIEFDLPEGHSTGTAFLVGYCTVLTSFHVAFGPWYVTALRPPSATNAGTFVLTGVTLPDGSHPTSRVVPVIWGDYTGPDRQYRKPSEDWVLLATEDCLGVPYGYLTMADLALQEDGADTGAFVSIGYSSGRQMVDPRCSIRLVVEEMSGGVLLHDCAAMPGDSGAPILRRGTGQVVAITSGYRAKGEGINCRPAGQSLRGGEASCSNTSVRLRHDIIGRMADADGAVITQRALLRLGYRAGTYGVIDDPSVRIAIREAQRDMGLPVNGEWSISLSKVLNLRRSGVLATTSMLNARD